jgi:hypothetical protein
VLGHAIIVGGSSWTNYPAGDVAIMAERGCSVAHAVWVFARRGVLMESFALYRRARHQRGRSAPAPIRRSVNEAMASGRPCARSIDERKHQATPAGTVVDCRHASVAPERSGATTSDHISARPPTARPGALGRPPP